MDFRKILFPIWDLVLKRVSKFVIPKFRDTLLVQKIHKMRGPPVPYALYYKLGLVYLLLNFSLRFIVVSLIDNLKRGNSSICGPKIREFNLRSVYDGACTVCKSSD